MNAEKALTNADLAGVENRIQSMNLMVPGPLIGSPSRRSVDLIWDSSDTEEDDRTTRRTSFSIESYASSHPDDANGENNPDDENSINSMSGSISPASADTTFGIVSLLEVDSTVDGSILRDDEVAFISSATAFVSRERPFHRRVKKSECRMLRRLGWGVRGEKKWQKAWIEYRRRHPYHQVLVEEDQEQSSYLTRTTSAIKENLKEVFVEAITSITNSVNKLGFQMKK